MAAILTVMGQDVSAYVSDWGQVEDIKEVLLGRARLFTAEHSVKLTGYDGRFNPYRSEGLFYQKPWFQSLVTIVEDGDTIFAGFLKMVQPDKADRSVTLTIQNYLAPASTKLTAYAQTAVNPVVASLAILAEAGLTTFVDQNSFISAAGGANLAGATVDVNYAGSSTTCLSAVEELCTLAGITVIVKAGFIKAFVDRAYQGSSAGLRFPIQSSNVVSFGPMDQRFDNLTNVVTVKYAATSIQLKDSASISRYHGYQNEVILDHSTSQAVVIQNLASATYFGGLYLTRSSTLISTLTVNGSTDLKAVRIGDLHPVTETFYGLNAEPFKVIETHRTITQNTITLVLATLK